MSAAVRRGRRRPRRAGREIDSLQLDGRNLAELLETAG
jgi:hypothetical protein